MIIRQAAFTKGKPFMKGGLHCHTTRSDGQGTPEDVIRQHAENGYVFLALTDHNIFGCKNYAPETGLTILSGIERNMDLPGPKQDKPICVHIVGVGVPGDPRSPQHDTKIPVYPAGQTGKDAQGMIDEMRGWGLVTHYCHPEWSGTAYADFRDLDVDYGMEVWNSGCAIEDSLDTNAAYWDEALQDGKVMYGVATDDGHPVYQHCRGWVMVSADNTPADIIDGLMKGEFYASCGPEIYDFYIEDGVAHVECSPVRTIEFITLRFPLHASFSDPERKEDITEGSCKLPEGLRYIRASVVDAEGRRAWTNPIILR